MSTPTYKKNDYGFTDQWQLTQGESSFPLTDVDGVRLLFTKPDGSVEERDLSIDDVSEGLVSYTWADGDLDQVGIYRGLFVVDLPEGPLTMPTPGINLWVVEETIEP